MTSSSIKNVRRGVLIVIVLVAQVLNVQCFSSASTGFPIAGVPKLGSKQYHSDSRTTKVCAKRSGDDDDDGVCVASFLKSAIVGTAIFGSLTFSGAAFADEIGVSIDAPMLYTGEEKMICVKRGPLGACTKTEKRTAENDNDKATKYFNDPELKFQEKYRAAQLQAIEDERNGLPKAGSAEFDGNALVARLKKQTEENRIKNDAIVRKQTLQNDLGASFGPFSKTVPILNADGVGYTLLDNPVAMRLKKAGFIDNSKKFITMPPQETIDRAYEDSQTSTLSRIGGFIDGILGNDEKTVEAIPSPPAVESRASTEDVTSSEVTSSDATTSEVTSSEVTSSDATTSDTPSTPPTSSESPDVSVDTSSPTPTPTSDE